MLACKSSHFRPYISEFYEGAEKSHDKFIVKRRNWFICLDGFSCPHPPSFCSVPRFLCVLVGAERPPGPVTCGPGWSLLSLNTYKQGPGLTASESARSCSNEEMADTKETTVAHLGKLGLGGLCSLRRGPHSYAAVSFLCAEAASWVSQSQKEVSVGEQSRAAIVFKEEVKVGGFCPHWSIVCKHSYLGQEKLYHSSGPPLGKPTAISIGPRHWDPWHAHVHANSSPSLRTSSVLTRRCCARCWDRDTVIGLSSCKAYTQQQWPAQPDLPVGSALALIPWG